MMDNLSNGTIGYDGRIKQCYKKYNQVQDRIVALDRQCLAEADAVARDPFEKAYLYSRCRESLCDNLKKSDKALQDCLYGEDYGYDDPVCPEYNV
jgi:hypothetical protein